MDADRAPMGVSIFERIAALMLTILLSPVMALVALVIKLDSPDGPVLYKQERVGLNRRRDGRSDNGSNGTPERRSNGGIGQVFWIYKFRTMVPDAEKRTGPVWATERDPRVTRLGRVLRHLRLDELPQLFNVMKGEMRLIGPRPERPHFVKQLSEMIPDYRYRQAVPPGITGLAQVEREYDSSIDDVRKKVKYDLFYVRYRCNLMDVKILLKTIDVALRGRGAR